MQRSVPVSSFRATCTNSLYQYYYLGHIQSRFERLHVDLKHNFSNFHFMICTSCAPLARPSVLTQQHVWLFDLYLCSSSHTYHCLFDDWYACSCLDGISFVCLFVLQPHSIVMFVYEPICPLSVEYDESIIKDSPISKTRV